MLVLFVLSASVWVLSTRSSSIKNLEPFNISNLRTLGNLGIICVASIIVGAVMSFFSPFHNFSTDNITYAIPCTLFAYVLHAVHNRGHRESIREYFKLDKWNVLALVGSIQYGIFMSLTYI